jgi:hypothetical protein
LGDNQGRYIYTINRRIERWGIKRNINKSSQRLRRRNEREREGIYRRNRDYRVRKRENQREKKEIEM